jgi:hypothetical protein
MFYRSARLSLTGVVCTFLILFSSCHRSHHCDTYGKKTPLQPGDVVVEQPSTIVSAEHKETVVVPPHVAVETKPVTPPSQPLETKPVETKPVVPPPVAKELPPVEKGPFKPIRIRAGSISAWTDAHGNVWQPDSGFSEGAMVDRGKIAIANTDMPDLYMTERCCMEKFVWAVPNGRYTLKLHFAETFDEVKKPGDRLFGLDVSGQKIKDFDIFKEAGGANRALVKSFQVEVKNGKVEIDFTKSENKEPEINGIEILPE